MLRNALRSLALLAALATPAAAQDWPTRPVTVIVTFAAGGNADTLGRIFAERMTARFGQQFVIENRAGAGGTTGISAMTRAAADGYTVSVATGSGYSYNPVIMKDKLPYNPEKDIAYLHLIHL